MTPPSSPAPRAPEAAGLPNCWFCGDAITDIHDGYLEIFHGPSFTYPEWSGALVFVFAHAECGPDGGYNIDFPRLLSDGVGNGPRSWYLHLLDKDWFDSDCLPDLEKGYKAARRVREYMQASHAPEPAPMRSVLASIPRRPPRTPENPRNIRPAMRARVMERDGFHCRRCGCGPNDSPLVVDHIIPVAKGGTGAFDNLQTLCRICNAGKSDAEPHPHDLGVRT